MVLFPSVQAEAQKELDQVVGAGRMPEWSDRDELPYVRACVEESLRCYTTPFLQTENVLTSYSRDANDTHSGCSSLFIE